MGVQNMNKIFPKLTASVSKNLRIWGPPLAILVSSRILVFLSGRFGTRHIPFDYTAERMVSAPAWFRWDAAFYLDIATHGYGADYSTAFFPLYPLLGHIASRASGFPIHLTLLVLANVFFILAVLVLFDLVRREWNDETALVAVAGLSFFPSTVFLSAGYAESLFLLLALITFRYLHDGKVWSAAFFAGLASASRPLGFLLALSVVVDSILRTRNHSGRTVICSLLLGLVSVWGLLGYAGYLGLTFGHPLMFASAQFLWHGPVEPLWGHMPWRMVQLVVTSGSREAMVNGVFFLSFTVLTLLGVRLLPARYTVFSIGALCLLYWRAPYVLFFSANRHVLSIVPVYLTLAVLLSRRMGYALAVIGISAGLSVFWTALYVQGYLIR